MQDKMWRRKLNASTFGLSSARLEALPIKHYETTSIPKGDTLVRKEAKYGRLTLAVLLEGRTFSRSSTNS
jgi:hypothetical protein